MTSVLVAGEPPVILKTSTAEMHVERSNASSLGKNQNVKFSSFCTLMPGNCSESQVVNLAVCIIPLYCNCEYNHFYSNNYICDAVERFDIY